MYAATAIAEHFAAAIGDRSSCGGNIHHHYHHNRGAYFYI
jgi:hypothetical protein